MKTKRGSDLPSSLSCGSLPLERSEEQNEVEPVAEEQKSDSRLRRSLGGRVCKRKSTVKHCSLPSLLLEGTTHSKDSPTKIQCSKLTKDAGRTPKVPRKMMVRPPKKLRNLEDEMLLPEDSYKSVNNLDESGGFLEPKETVVRFAGEESIDKEEERVPSSEKDEMTQQQLSSELPPGTPEGKYMARNAGSTPKLSRIRDMDPHTVLEVMKKLDLADGSGSESSQAKSDDEKVLMLKGTRQLRSLTKMKKISSSVFQSLKSKESSQKKAKGVQRRTSLSLFCGLSKSRIVSSLRRKEGMPRRRSHHGGRLLTPNKSHSAGKPEKSRAQRKSSTSSGGCKPDSCKTETLSETFENMQRCPCKPTAEGDSGSTRSAGYNTRNAGSTPKEADDINQPPSKSVKEGIASEKVGKSGQKATSAKLRDFFTKDAGHTPKRSKSLRLSERVPLRSMTRFTSHPELNSATKENKAIKEDNIPKSAMKHPLEAMLSPEDGTCSTDQIFSSTPLGGQSGSTKVTLGKRVLIPNCPDTIIPQPPRKKANLIRKMSARRGKKETVEEGEGGPLMRLDAGHTPRLVRRKGSVYNERLIE